MQLDQLQVVLRPRTQWEAMDLGAAMVRRWWRPLSRAWLVSAIPLQGAILALLWQHPGWAFFALWYVKPFMDRVALLVLSRALFGAIPSAWEVFKSLPRLWTRRVFSVALFDRINSHRSAWLPVDQLEGLSRGPFRARRRALLDGAKSAPTALALTGWLVELALVIGLAVLMWMMIPEELVPVGLEELWETRPLWGRLLPALFALAFTLVSPFYTAAGFALYLDRRTLLEGWDIELVFRQLTARVEAARVATRSKVAALACALLFGGAAQALEPNASYDPNDKSPKAAITRVLARPEFQNKQKVTRWVPNEPRKPREPSGPSKWADAIAALMESVAEGVRLLLWALFGAAILGLVVLVARALRRSGVFDAKGARPSAAAVVITGQPIETPKRLDDPVQAARALWLQNQPSAALGVLYRSAVFELTDSHGVQIPEGATESQCIAAVRKHAPNALGYFRVLANAWLATAFAHRPPDGARFAELCDGWSAQFPRADA
jgi:hypothetical protein